MIRDVKTFKEWEDDWYKNQSLNLEEKFKLLEGMYQEAKTLGVFPLKNPLEGIDFKIKFARDIHVRRAA